MCRIGTLSDFADSGKCQTLKRTESTAPFIGRCVLGTHARHHSMMTVLVFARVLEIVFVRKICKNYVNEIMCTMTKDLVAAIIPNGAPGTSGQAVRRIVELK